jgi:poly(beta-D-mannuronate) lyase
VAISKDMTIRSADSKTKPIIKLQSERDNNCFFEIGGNARVCFEGLAFDADSKAKYPAKYIITTSKEDANGYSLLIDNCEMYDLNVETGAIFKAYKGSIADSVKISNSVLRDSYRAINLGDEKDDVGKYSVEYLVFENTVFSNFTQYVLDYYRGGNDESTLGGSLFVDHCVFDNVGADEKQYVLKLTNIVKVLVQNTIFNNSMAKTVVKLSGSKNIVLNSCFYDCNKPKVEFGATSTNIVYDNPKFEKKSFILSQKSSLLLKGTDGSNIGLK